MSYVKVNEVLGYVPEDPAMRPSTTAKLVLAVIASHLGTNETAFPSQERLADMASCSVATVRRSLRELESLGLLAVTRQRRAPNRYRVTLPRPHTIERTSESEASLFAQSASLTAQSVVLDRSECAPESLQESLHGESLQENPPIPPQGGAGVGASEDASFVQGIPVEEPMPLTEDAVAAEVVPSVDVQAVKRAPAVMREWMRRNRVQGLDDRLAIEALDVLGAKVGEDFGAWLDNEAPRTTVREVWRAAKRAFDVAA